MSNDDEGTVTLVFRRMTQGDQEAANQIWEEYFPRLIKLARATFAGSDHVVTSASDAVQSAFVNFWQQAERGDFPEGIDRTELWKLLATITKRKCYKHFERERAERRGGGKRVVRESRLAGDEEKFLLDQLAGPMPAKQFDLVMEELLSKLEPDLRAIVFLRLSNHSNKEIGEQLGWTIRRVERKFSLVRELLQEMIDDLK